MPEIATRKADFFKALGHPLRIRMLELLSDEPRSVSALLAVLDTGQPQLSRHLGQLRREGLVLAQREGSSVLYSVADERITELLRLSRGLLLDMATATRDELRRS